MSIHSPKTYPIKTALQVITLITCCFSVGHIAAKKIPNIKQIDKKFSVEKLQIKVGDTVSFTNNDPFFHNVFSLSPASTFDLGSYSQGESRTVTFDEAGEILVECAIHPSMQMTIEVTE